MPASLFTALNTATSPLLSTLLTNSIPIHNHTQSAIDIYLASLDTTTGLIPSLSYWQNANGYTAIALHDLWGEFTLNNATLHANLITVMDGLGHSARGVPPSPSSSSSNETHGIPNAKPPDTGNSARMKRGVLSARGANFLNAYNDDSMWWALVALETWSLTHNEERLISASRQIWTHVSAYQLPPGTHVNDIDMSGGVIWTSYADEGNVNVITTSLYAELGARLAMLEDRKGEERNKYLRGAQQAVGWVVRNRLDEAKWVVMDTIDWKTGERKDWTFTYNTGQTIAATVAVYCALKDTPELGIALPVPGSGPVERSSMVRSVWNFFLRRRSGDANGADTASSDSPEQIRSQYLRLALKLALPAMTRCPEWTDADGTLTERSAYPGPDNKTALDNNDAVGFKSVLLRSLVKLYRVLREEAREQEMREKIRAFVLWQYVSLMERDRDWSGKEGRLGEGYAGEDGTGKVKMQFGPWWAGPWDTPTSHSQMAALDAMAALWGVVERGPV
jgi:hypothetical protein